MTAEREVCGHYDGVRYCRNKPFAHRTDWQGNRLPGLCRKHTVETLKKYAADNRQLEWFLEYRHLLEPSA